MKFCQKHQKMKNLYRVPPMNCCSKHPKKKIFRKGCLPLMNICQKKSILFKVITDKHKTLGTGIPVIQISVVNISFIISSDLHSGISTSNYVQSTIKTLLDSTWMSKFQTLNSNLKALCFTD